MPQSTHTSRTRLSDAFGSFHASTGKACAAGAAAGREAASVAGREALRLGSTGIGSSDVNRKRESRGRRYALRDKMRLFADRSMVAVCDVDARTGEVVERRLVPREDKFLACGRRMREAGGAVAVKSGADGAGFGGLQACGSGWVCPVCSAKIQRHRADELGRVLAWARGEGHTLAMITLTVRHNRAQKLGDVWDAVSAGWGNVTGGIGRGFWGSEKLEKYEERRDKWEAARQLALDGKGRMPRGGRTGTFPERRVGDAERYGVLGWARAVEVTDGINGWHVHVHAVVVLEGRQDGKKRAQKLGDAMFARWQAGIGSAGFEAVKHLGGLHVSVKEAAARRLAEYLAKDGLDLADASPAAQKIRAGVGKQARKLAMEAALGDAKRGRRGGRTPFQILEEIDPAEPGRDLARWREWVETSGGRMALTWSRGLREMAKLDEVPLSDEEIAQHDAAGDVVVLLPASSWALVVDDSAALLDVLEEEGPAGLMAWLDARHVPYDLPDTPPE